MSDPILSRFKIEWIDRGREPQCAPDPRYPNGVAMNLADGAPHSCNIGLPYPAKRCGIYMVECICGASAMVTTAGRADDPRSVLLACCGARYS